MMFNFCVYEYCNFCDVGINNKYKKKLFIVK